MPANTRVLPRTATLNDFVWAMLALAAIDAGQNGRIDMRDIQPAFAAVHEIFPHQFPAPVNFQTNGMAPYSKNIENALNRHIGSAIPIDPPAHSITVSHDFAIRQLARLREEVGDDYVDNLHGPVLEEFLQHVYRRRETRP